MNRYVFVLTLIVVGVATSILVHRPSQATRLTPHELASARGGNMEDAKCQSRCDEEAGLLIECTEEGADCQQCGYLDQNEDFQASTADVLGEPGSEGCGSSGGYTEEAGSQDCGTIWDGTCVVDAGSPTGFKCDMMDTELVCTEGIQPVVEQTPGPGDPGDP